MCIMVPSGKIRFKLICLSQRNFRLIIFFFLRQESLASPIVFFKEDLTHGWQCILSDGYLEYHMVFIGYLCILIRTNHFLDSFCVEDLG